MQALHVRNGEGEHFVFPGAIELTIIVPGARTEGAFAIFEDIVEPGFGPARHIHKSQDEVFFVLEGSFDLEIDGQLFHAGAGDVAFVPRGAVHAFKNTGAAAGRRAIRSHRPATPRRCSEPSTRP